MDQEAEDVLSRQLRQRRAMAGPVARIDLDALRHNLSRAREAASGCRVMAVIKADAYGHGAVEAAGALAEADALAVARVEEGVALRRAGISSRIVVLEGPVAAAELPLALAGDLELVIHHESQIPWLAPALERASRGLRCWIKVDTGMNRLGFRAEEADAAATVLRAIPGVVLCGVMTHLASADLRDDPMTGRQLERFRPLAGTLAREQSLANSAGILGWPASHGDWVRPGIMLYGASPFADESADALGLQPVMTLRTRLIAVKSCRSGETVGYGGTWRCPEDMPIGVAAIGYGDGYPRHAAAGTPVLVTGQRAALAGRVSMDMITIDLRTVPGARAGDPVVLWGDGLPVEEVATAAGTIAYELFCRLTGRVKFRYEAARPSGAN